MACLGKSRLDFCGLGDVESAVDVECLLPVGVCLVVVVECSVGVAEAGVSACLFVGDARRCGGVGCLVVSWMAW